METCIFKLSSEQTADRLREECLSPALIRIRAAYNAYGADYDFVRFFGDTENTCLICIKDGLAVVHIDDGKPTDNIVGFLSVAAESILSAIPLPLSGYSFSEETGLSFCLDSPAFETLDGITDGLQQGYELLKSVFPDSINDKTYSKWYTDLSHRVRHGVSRIYTLPGVCSCTISSNENGIVTFTHLGTHQDFRQKGYAKRMLSHIAMEENATRLLLASQNTDSDRFYEKLGFKQSGKWYIYELK